MRRTPNQLQPHGTGGIPCAEEGIARIRRRHIEVWSTGIDEALLGVTGDPYRGIAWTGLRVPTLRFGSFDRRYLFNLASFEIAEGARARLLGFRQLVTIGAAQAGGDGGSQRIIEQLVTNPIWKFPDGNISWHLMIVRTGEVNDLDPQPAKLGGGNTAFLASTQWMLGSTVSGLLYNSITTPNSPFYVDLTDYVPPNLGRPSGTPLQANMASFADLKTDWSDPSAWRSLDVPVDGPARVVFYASVMQTDPTSPNRPITPPGTFRPGGLSAEEQFLLNFPTAIYWRVGGALVFALDE